MKLHLPLSLRRSLVALLAAVAAAPAWAGVLTSDVDQVIYADFGQNRGRYSVTNVNALLNELNKDGVYIHYNNGQDAYKLEHGMISFESRQESGGSSAAINHNFIATVEHVGVQNPYFSFIELGGTSHAIQYNSIEYPGTQFVHDDSGRDFKVSRLSKIVTDVTTSGVYSSQKLASSNLAGEYLYHSGGGATYVYNPNTGSYEIIESQNAGALATDGHFLAGAIQKIDSVGGNINGGYWLYHNVTDWDTSTDPLPFGSRNGDSGSPVWVWDADAGEYKYFAAVSQWGADITYGVSDGNLKYIEDTTSSYNKTVETSSGRIQIGATSITDTTISHGSVSTTLWQGEVSDSSGVLTVFNGVEQGKSTWNDMADIRDKDNWYALTQNYLNAQQNNTTEGKLDYADLFMTDNLVFNAKDRKDYTIEVDSVVDTGIGYTEFTKGNQTSAAYEISGSGYLDSAGYIIGEDVEVHLQLVSSDKTREVRKIGDGTLYIDGTGQNDIMLNLGGKGKTILNQSEGYAAYNVLANNGTTVVLEGGVSQIKRDFTFGNGGGTLDFHGHSWTEGEEGNFSMKALTQDAVIANFKENSSSQVTFTAGGTYLGSFQDDKLANASLKVNYTGDGTWTLNSIHTKLEHADSGLSVNSGKVVLVGTETEHAASNLEGTDEPWQKDNDWHYSDAQMNVTVEDGAVFELGSHARLTGDVTVNGGTYIMREGVQNRYEYIEGGYTLEDTYAISSFYGHKGNTVLNGGTLQVEFSKGTTSKLEYSGNISGTGKMTVDTADGTLILTGENTFTGSKQLLNGHVIADDVSALGTGAGWQLDAGTTLTVQSGLTSENALTYVNAASSTGLLALGSDIDKVLDLEHSSLIIGAQEGKVVQYGATTDTISTAKLGGGGGTLVVNAAVSANNFVIGREGDTGTVRLANENNNLTGTVSMQGSVALDVTAAALGNNAKVNLAYGKGLMLRESLDKTASMITDGSAGALLLDYFEGNNLDMTSNAKLSALSLSAAGECSYGGTITANAYKLGGHTGTLELTNAKAISGDDSSTLLIDGKGTKGGRVVLSAAQSDFAGAVTVQGADTAATGDATLELRADNALSEASSIRVKNGGVLDIGSTKQTVKRLVVKDGSCVTAQKGSVLSINMEKENTEDYFQTGSYQVDKLEISGSQFVLASDKNEWNKLTVKGGTTLFTRVDNALSATGITCVEKDATLNLNTWDGDGFRSRTMHGNIQLANGATMITGSKSYDVYLTGSFKVEEGGTATVDGGKWHLQYGAYNSNGGTISFMSDALYFDYSAQQYIGGTLKVDDNTTFYGQKDSPSDYTQGRVVQLNHLDVSTDKTLIVNDNKGKTAWQFDKLTGSGNITWTSDWGAGVWANGRSARMTIGGDGQYAGQITLNRSYDQGAHRYQAFIEITGDEAVSGAVINLNGSHANDNASLAINTKNAKLKGLNGNQYSHLLAGAAPQGSASTSAPGSTAANSLIFTSSSNDEYTYSGTVAGGVAKGLVLVQGGTGTQSFNGSSVSLRGVEIQNTGTLDFSGVAENGLAVHGDIVLNAAGTLNMGSHQHSLDAGKSIIVTSAGANLTANLLLNGGSLLFDALQLDASSTLLNYSGTLTSQSGATVNFTNIENIFDENGSNQYVLASGDWSGVSGQLTAGNLGKYKAQFSADSTTNALVVTFSKNGYIWAGTNESSIWDGTDFSAEEGVSKYNANSNLVFSDSAENTSSIKLTGSSTIDNIFFDNSDKEYTISSDNGSSITANAITQSGSGESSIAAKTIVKTVEVSGGRLNLQNADLNGGHLKVQNGALSLGISSNETIPYLHLLDGARLELSATNARRLEVSNASRKEVNTTMELVALGKGTIYDYKSKYTVNEGGVLSIGDAELSNNWNTILGSIELMNSASLNVEAGNLAVVNGITLKEGHSTISISDEAIVAFAPTSKITTASGSGATAVIDVTNASLYINGTKTGDALKIRLGENAVLGSSNSSDCESTFDCDIVLTGNARLASDTVYQSTYNIRSTESVQGAVVYTGTITSEGEADLTVGSENGGIAIISNSASISGDLEIVANNSLGIAASDAYSIVTLPSGQRLAVQNAGAQISSKVGSNAAEISGGSTLAWDGKNAVIRGDGKSRAVVKNSLVELYDGATLKLQNVMLGSDSQIKTEADSATIEASNVGLLVRETAGNESTLDTALTLNLSGTDKTYTLESGSKVLEITTDLLAGNLTLTGESLMVDFVGYDVELYDAIQLNFASGVTVDTNMVIAAQAQVEQGTTPQLMTGSYVTGGNVGSIVFIMNHNIPEPATTTLSLLALAGLAGRRRRR